MTNIFNDIYAFYVSLFCPLFALLSYIDPPAWDDDAWASLVYTLQWFALFHNTSIFPTWFSVILDTAIVSRLVFGVIDFIFWVKRGLLF